MSISTSNFKFNKFRLLLSKYNYQLKKNDILAGVLVGIEPNYALVDLGLDQICFLPLKELSFNFKTNNSLKELLRNKFIGEFLILKNNNTGPTIISLKQVESIYLWNRLRQLDFKNLVIYAKVEKRLGRGKLVRFNGLYFFVLNSNIPKYYRRINNRNLFIPFKFIEIKDYLHVAHVSAKCAIFSKLNNSLEIGSIYSGNVVSLKDFGMLINVLGIKCLVHISEISKNQIFNFTSSYKRGDQIQLKVISKNLERARVSISLKL